MNQPQIDHNKQSETKSSLWRQAIVGAVMSLIVLIIPIVGYVTHLQADAIWAATFVVQVGLALLWTVVKLGAFSTTSFGFRRLGTAVVNAKHAKLGAYSDTKPRQSPYASALDVERKNSKKGWWGVYAMLLIAIPELIIMLVVNFG